MISSKKWPVGLFKMNIIFLIIGITIQGTATLGQNLDTQHFQAAPGPHDLLTTSVSRPTGEFLLYGSLALDYANDEVHWRALTRNVRPVTDRLQSNLAVTLGLSSRIDISFAVPVILWQHSVNYPNNGDEKHQTGIGGIRLSAKGTLRDNTEGGLGCSVGFTLFESTERDADWMSESMLTFAPQLTIDYLFKNHFLVVSNIGYHFRPSAQIGPMDTRKSAILARVGIELPFHVYGLSVVGEVNTEIISPFPAQNSQIKRLSPMELLVALRWRGEHGSVTLGNGVGLTEAYGAPDWRAVLTLGYFTGTHPTLGKSTSQRATPPKNEASVQREQREQREQPTAATAKRRKEKQALAARPSDEEFDKIIAADPDMDGDGLGKEQDKCEDQAEDFDGFEDSDGCPDPDNDGDGILDTEDSCPQKAEIINGIDDEDGCPDEGKTTIASQDGHLTMDQKVFFTTGSDKLNQKSKVVLDQIAGFLKMNWAIRLVQIEGFTDSRGDPEANVYLSQRRAQRVRSYLIEKGISDRRLSAKGFGPAQPDSDTQERPVQSKKQSKKQSNDRFVTFSVLEQANAGGEK